MSFVIKRMFPSWSRYSVYIFLSDGLGRVYFNRLLEMTETIRCRKWCQCDWRKCSGIVSFEWKVSGDGMHCGGTPVPIWETWVAARTLFPITVVVCWVLAMYWVKCFPFTNLFNPYSVSVRLLCPHLTGRETDSQRKTKGHTYSKLGSWEFVPDLAWT